MICDLDFGSLLLEKPNLLKCFLHSHHNGIIDVFASKPWRAPKTGTSSDHPLEHLTHVDRHRLGGALQNFLEAGVAGWRTGQTGPEPAVWGTAGAGAGAHRDIKFRCLVLIREEEGIWGEGVRDFLGEIAGVCDLEGPVLGGCCGRAGGACAGGGAGG